MDRPYHWLDRVIIMKNSVPGGGRPCLGETKFSLFQFKNHIIKIDHFKYGKFELRFEDFEIVDKNYYRRKKLENILKK